MKTPLSFPCGPHPFVTAATRKKQSSGVQRTLVYTHIPNSVYPCSPLAHRVPFGDPYHCVHLFIGEMPTLVIVKVQKHLVSVAVLQWAAMPVASAALAWWLRPCKECGVGRSIAGFLLIVALLVGMTILFNLYG